MNLSSSILCKSTENLKRPFKSTEIVSDIEQQNPHLHKDTTYTKIFVGGLPYHTTDETLKNYFEYFGELEEAVVITDRQTGKSRGYGFVTMKNSDDAMKAIIDPNPCIDGRKTNVNLAILGAKPRNVPSITSILENLSSKEQATCYNTVMSNNFSNPLLNIIYPTVPNNGPIQPILSQRPYSANILNHPIKIPIMSPATNCYFNINGTPSDHFWNSHMAFPGCQKVSRSPQSVHINSNNKVILKSELPSLTNFPLVQLQPSSMLYPKFPFSNL